MKTVTTLLIAATASFSLSASADTLYNDPGISDVFPMENIVFQTQERNLVKDTGQEVWSVEYEQWINPADFNSIAKQTVASALQELENNPPAAGKRANSTFTWDETAGEYQLQ